MQSEGEVLPNRAIYKIVEGLRSYPLINLRLNFELRMF